MAAYDAGNELADDLRKRKKKKNAPDETETTETTPDATESEQELKSAADAVDELLGESTAKPDDAGEGGPAEPTTAVTAEGGDPAQVFADALGMSPEMAAAVYNEAMGMPELAEMTPEQMVKEIDGDYELLKKLFQGVSERAELAMQEAMEAPMPPPDMGGPGAGMPGPGGAPMGPDMGAQPPMM